MTFRLTTLPAPKYVILIVKTNSLCGIVSALGVLKKHHVVRRVKPMENFGKTLVVTNIYLDDSKSITQKSVSFVVNPGSTRNLLLCYLNVTES